MNTYTIKSTGETFNSKRDDFTHVVLVKDPTNPEDTFGLYSKHAGLDKAIKGKGTAESRGFIAITEELGA